MSKVPSPFPAQSSAIPLEKTSSNVASGSTIVPARPFSQIAPSSTSSSLWQAPAHWNTSELSSSPAVSVLLKRKSAKLKKRSQEERDIASRTSARLVPYKILLSGLLHRVLNITRPRVAARLAADHQAVLYPDTETPFADAVDVVNRLLPYHVFQQPQEDLEYAPSSAGRKGKQKASKEEIEIEG